MTDLHAVSLFAGIGGFDLALHQAGIPTVAAVEIDPAARGVLADRLPGTALFNDVTEVSGDQLRAAGFDPRRGVLVGGWPCQDLSLAGRRLGLGGARSGLFWEVVRLIADLRPRWFVLENVPGLLSAVCACPGAGRCTGRRVQQDDGTVRVIPCDDPHPVPGGDCGRRRTRRGQFTGPGRCMGLHGGAMGAVVGALAELRYGVGWRVLDAQYLGVPQRRRRVFLVGHSGGGAAPVQVLLEPEGSGRDSAAGRPARPGPTAVAALGASDGGADDNDATGGRLIATCLRARRQSKGVDSDATDTLVVGPLQAGGAGGRGHRIDAEGAANGHLIAATVSAKWAKGTGGPSGRGEGGNLVASFDLAQITSRQNRSTVSAGSPASTLAAGSQLHVTHAMTCEGHDASENGTGRGTPLVAFDWKTDGGPDARPNVSTERTSGLRTEHQDAVLAAQAVRRLTPTECERLQGFPDGWTATSGGAAQSDSARYRQLGNAVAVPVVAWIARRLAAVDRGAL